MRTVLAFLLTGLAVCLMRSGLWLGSLGLRLRMKPKRGGRGTIKPEIIVLGPIRLPTIQTKTIH